MRHRRIRLADEGEALGTGDTPLCRQTSANQSASLRSPAEPHESVRPVSKMGDHACLRVPSPLTDSSLDTRLGYRCGDRRPLKSGLHDFPEPRCGIRRHNDLFDKDFQIHRHIPASIFGNIWIEGNIRQIICGPSRTRQDGAYLVLAAVLHALVEERRPAEPGYPGLAVVNVRYLPERDR